MATAGSVNGPQTFPGIPRTCWKFWRDTTSNCSCATSHINMNSDPCHVSKPMRALEMPIGLLQTLLHSVKSEVRQPILNRVYIAGELLENRCSQVIRDKAIQNRREGHIRGRNPSSDPPFMRVIG